MVFYSSLNVLGDKPRNVYFQRPLYEKDHPNLHFTANMQVFVDLLLYGGSI